MVDLANPRAQHPKVLAANEASCVGSWTPLAWKTLSAVDVTVEVNSSNWVILQTGSAGGSPIYSIQGSFDGIKWMSLKTGVCSDGAWYRPVHKGAHFRYIRYTKTTGSGYFSASLFQYGKPYEALPVTGISSQIVDVLPGAGLAATIGVLSPFFTIYSESTNPVAISMVDRIHSEDSQAIVVSVATGIVMVETTDGAGDAQVLPVYDMLKFTNYGGSTARFHIVYAEV